MKHISGMTFYPFLLSRPDTKGLDSESFLTDESIVICWERDSRLFTYFPDYLGFTQFLLRLSADQWCFHEIVRGHCYQRLRFDIDMEMPSEHSSAASSASKPSPLVAKLAALSAHNTPPSPDKMQALQDELIDACQEVLGPLDLTRDVVICDSSGPEKLSRHIILPNHGTANSESAQHYCSLIIDRLSATHASSVDRGIYSPNHPLRTLFSVKKGTTRRKRMLEEWRHHDRTIRFSYDEEPKSDRHRMLLQLGVTLITNAQRVKLSPTIVKPKPVPTVVLDAEVGYQALSLYAEVRGMKVEDEGFPYRLLGVEGGLVLLKRERASLCPVCVRVHEKENPFMTVDEDNIVRFYCRRNTSHYVVGRLGLKVEPEVEVTGFKPRIRPQLGPLPCPPEGEASPGTVQASPSRASVITPPAEVSPVAEHPLSAPPPPVEELAPPVAAPAPLVSDPSLEDIHAQLRKMSTRGSAARMSISDMLGVGSSLRSSLFS
jgi:hypothetical protein